MTGDERAAWVKVARETLKDYPADILKECCQAARKRCRFPSEIVPVIVEEAAKVWAGRRMMIEYTQPQIAGPDPYPSIPKAETQRILREVAEGMMTRKTRQFDA